MADLSPLLSNVTFEVSLATVPSSDALLPSVTKWHTPPPCGVPVASVAAAAGLNLNKSQDCVSTPCTADRCNFTITLPVPGIRYSISVRNAEQGVHRVHDHYSDHTCRMVFMRWRQVRSVLLSVNGTESKMEWDYKRCDDKSFFTVTYPNGSISCNPCPQGGDCTAPSGAQAWKHRGGKSHQSMLTPCSPCSCIRCSIGVCLSEFLFLCPAVDAVVEQRAIIAKQGWWASGRSDGTLFYECLQPEACLPGKNGSRATCAPGYAGILCAVCADGYFEQFGRWVGFYCVCSKPVCLFW